MSFKYSLKQLRYLVTTIECGSISEASRRLNISNPAISSAIKDLESRFNLQIFIRHKSNGLILTPEGSSFFERAISLLRDAREFEQQVNGDSEKVSGEIVLACYDPIASCYLPELLASFKERFPAVKISLHVVHQNKIAEGLRSGAYDLALTYSAGLRETHTYLPLLPDLYPRAGIARWPPNNNAAISPNPTCKTNAGAGMNAGRCNTLPKVLANSALRTGCGAQAL